jgi:outer membrane lipoprotein SlyB
MNLACHSAKCTSSKKKKFYAKAQNQCLQRKMKSCQNHLMKLNLLVGFSTILLFSSCAQDSMTGNTYSRDETRQAQSVRKGRITDIRPVKIEGNSTAGAIIGGIAGGALGSNIGSGRTSNTAGAIGGALVGGALGSHAQQAMQSRKGIEITVRLDEGGSLAVVQEISASEPFRVGDRVRVLSTGSRTRVAY